MLYDDSDQVEVRHVISLAHHTVDIYGGAQAIPEGELFIKRNCIRLTRTASYADETSKSKPFFLFSDDCSQKEDFYLALLQNQDRRGGSAQDPPIPMQFEPAHMMKLIQQLHASEENMQTRWLNALLGRLFLALYNTSELEDFVRTKITKKIARVPKPAFLGDIKIQDIKMGDCAPIFTNPKLKEFTLDGDLTLEADVKYSGNFRLEISTVARIELGPRFKAREVSLLLAGILKKLEGHLLIRIKPPPSNRFWISFETMPKMELSIEPVVSSRQITYGIILRTIESRFRETIGETIVLPNWDDTPFFNTAQQRFRGGIFKPHVKNHESFSESQEHSTDTPLDLNSKVTESNGSDAAVTSPLVSNEKSTSTPALIGEQFKRLDPSKDNKPSLSTGVSGDSGVSSGFSAQPRGDIEPRRMKSRPSGSAAASEVSMVSATADQHEDKRERGWQAADTVVRDESPNFETTSPLDSSVSSPQFHQVSGNNSSEEECLSSEASQISREEDSHREKSQNNAYLSSGDPESTGAPQKEDKLSHSSTESSLHSRSASLTSTPFLTSKSSTTEKRSPINQSLASATNAAKKWGWNVLNRNQRPKSTNLSESPVSSSHEKASRSSIRQPLGRGQPLPPPGTPLPPPRNEKAKWNMQLPSTGLNIINVAKRKPVPPPLLPKRPNSQSLQSPPPLSSPQIAPSTPSSATKGVQARNASLAESSRDGGRAPDGDGLLVIAAPVSEDSVPPSPASVVSTQSTGGANSEVASTERKQGSDDAARSMDASVSEDDETDSGSNHDERNESRLGTRDSDPSESNNPRADEADEESTATQVDRTRGSPIREDELPPESGTRSHEAQLDNESLRVLEEFIRSS
jgi:hypothetical protein